MRRLLVISLLLLTFGAGSAGAQVGIPVFDLKAIGRLLEIVDRVQKTLDAMRDIRETTARMGKGMGNLSRYRLPGIPTLGHDVSRFPYGRPWLEGLNSGDARGQGYFATVHTIQRDLGVLDQLPPQARDVVKVAYATIEILDSINMMGGHQAAAIRGYHGKLAESIQQLENDITSPRPELHEMTAVLDKIAVAQSINGRQNMAGNQLDSHILEQLLGANKEKRDTDASNMNMMLNGIRAAGSIDRSLVRDGDFLTTWRQP
jgi:hypothetical protein